MDRETSSNERDKQEIAQVVKDLEKALTHRIPQAAKRSQETLLDELEAYLLILSLKEKLRLDT